MFIDFSNVRVGRRSQQPDQWRDHLNRCGACPIVVPGRSETGYSPACGAEKLMGQTSFAVAAWGTAGVRTCGCRSVYCPSSRVNNNVAAHQGCAATSVKRVVCQAQLEPTALSVCAM